MTDVEKAEEYADKKLNKLVYCSCCQNPDVKQAYLDGLAEGRKELEKELGWITDTDNYVSSKLARCFELEKENAELKAQIENYQLSENEGNEIIAELKEQNKIILEDNDTLNKWVDELREQIEKMKSFIHSEIDFCMYCPLTNECVNDEGACPYAYATEEEQKSLLMDYINKIGS